MRNVNRGNKPGLRKCRLRKGDKVMITAGASVGTGPVEVLQVLPEKGKILVKGINLKTKHLQKSQENPKGGIEKVEAPIDFSNVLLYSEKLKRGVRIRVEERDGKKVRVGVPCGTVFD